MRLLVSSTPKILPSLLPDFAPWLGTLVTPSNGAFAQARRLWSNYGMPWAADNECFLGLDSVKYRGMLARIAGAPGCLWVTVPDVVGDAAATMSLFDDWADEVKGSGHPLALVAQDGAESLPVPWDRIGALFIGGSTEWKLSAHAAGLAAKALSMGKAVHMGRVNTLTRYRHAHAIGCHTVDGTNVCMWPDIYLPRCARWLRSLDTQLVLFS